LREPGTPTPALFSKEEKRNHYAYDSLNVKSVLDVSPLPALRLPDVCGNLIWFAWKSLMLWLLQNSHTQEQVTYLSACFSAKLFVISFTPIRAYGHQK
jgi:hypothetical protein